MPLYEYQCTKCGQRTEALQRLNVPPLTVCPQCGGELRKLVSAPAFQFKGSGWYVTDYAGKKPGAAAPAETKTGDDKSGSSPAQGSTSEKAGKSGPSESTPKPPSSQ